MFLRDKKMLIFSFIFFNLFDASKASWAQRERMHEGGCSCPGRTKPEEDEVEKGATLHNTHTHANKVHVCGADNRFEGDPECGWDVFGTKRVEGDLQWCASWFKSVCVVWEIWRKEDAMEQISPEYRAKDAGIFNKCGKVIRLCIQRRSWSCYSHTISKPNLYYIVISMVLTMTRRWLCLLTKVSYTSMCALFSFIGKLSANVDHLVSTIKIRTASIHAKKRGLLLFTWAN